MSLISCAVMPYACTTVHGRGSSLQRRTMPDFGFKAASSHVSVCVVSVLSSTWMTCSNMLWSRIRRSFGPCKEVGHISRNSVSVHLCNSVLHSHQIAARRLRGMAGRVFGEVRLICSKQVPTLFFSTFGCSRVEFFCKVHTFIVRRLLGRSSHEGLFESKLLVRQRSMQGADGP